MHHSDKVFVVPSLTEIFVVLIVDASVFTTTCNERDAHFVLLAKGRAVYQNMREGSALWWLHHAVLRGNAARIIHHIRGLPLNVSDIERKAPVRSNSIISRTHCVTQRLT